MCKRIIAVFLVVMLISSGMTAYAQASPYTYEILQDGTVRITDYSGTDEVLIIPDEIDGRAVSTIGRDAISASWSVKTLVIPDTVTTIEDDAFSYLYFADTIYMSDSVTYIGDYAFFNCTADFFLPSSVTHIGEMALGYGNFGRDSGAVSGDIAVNPDCVLYAPDNAVVAAYAAENGIRYENLAAFDKGDVDLNATVNTTDARQILKELVYGHVMCPFIGDVDDDGQVNTSDVRCIIYDIIRE